MYWQKINSTFFVLFVCLFFIYIFYSVETAINCSPDQKYQFFPTNQLLAGRITNRSQQLYNWHRIKH